MAPGRVAEAPCWGCLRGLERKGLVRQCLWTEILMFQRRESEGHRLGFGRGVKEGPGGCQCSISLCLVEVQVQRDIWAGVLNQPLPLSQMIQPCVSKWFLLELGSEWAEGRLCVWGGGVRGGGNACLRTREGGA